MRDEHRSALIAAIRAQLPDEATLKAFLKPWRPGAWASVPPGTPYPKAAELMVGDALQRRWIRDFVARLVAQLPGSAAFASVLEAIEHDVVDAFPFPFSLPLAQELVRVMASLFPSESDALDFAWKAGGVDPIEVTRGVSPIRLWRELLDKTARDSTTRRLITETIARFPTNPRVPFLQGLLDDVPVVMSAEPVALDAPRFLTGDDKVTRNEALLFFDDLTMPVGRVSNLIASITKVLAKASAVCLLRVVSHAGDEYFGTGFRIGGEFVLTNEHVLVPRGYPAVRVRADFDFDVDAADNPLSTVSLVGDPASIVAEREDDWAVVKIPNMDAAWPVIELASAAPPKPGDVAYIIQHPAAARKRLGFVRNTISDVDDRVLHYLTDTQPGSSGSPVFDASGDVIGLHHAGGAPQAVAGKSPVSKNEGIRTSRVLERLRARGVL